MTDEPRPILSTALPPTPAPEWEFHTWFPRPDGGGDFAPGRLSRGVQVRRRVTYGPWEPVAPARFADDPTGGADDWCGAEPPPGEFTARDGTVGEFGDCDCTRPVGHDGDHACEPCTARHGAPGWAQLPP